MYVYVFQGIPSLRMIFNGNISYITQNMMAITHGWVLNAIAKSPYFMASLYLG